MLVYNPTQEPIVAKYDGARYIFKPQERLEIFNAYAATHIVSRWGKYGLVDITWNDKIAGQYPDHELYVHHQRVMGLTKLWETLEEQHQQYLQYDVECGDKQTTARIGFRKQREAMKQRMDQLRRHIDEIEKLDVQEYLVAKAERLRKQAAELEQQAKAAEAVGGNHVKQLARRSPDRAS